MHVLTMGLQISLDVGSSVSRSALEGKGSASRKKRGAVGTLM
jgi:hypothetical protein